MVIKLLNREKINECIESGYDHWAKSNNETKFKDLTEEGQEATRSLFSFISFEFLMTINEEIENKSDKQKAPKRAT